MKPSIRRGFFAAAVTAAFVISSSSVLLAGTAPEDTSIQASIPAAKRLFRRLTGVPILLTDPRLSQMAGLIAEGRAREAAAIATEDSNFYQVTVKNLAAELSSKNETPYIGLDDFQATFIGTVRDEIDARSLLTGNYLYKSPIGVASRRDNKSYDAVDDQHLDYKSILMKQEPQWTGDEAMRNHAGLMTTRAWGWNYDAGTNRRAVVNAFSRFLCKPIGLWKVPYLDEDSIARDVDRNPGGNPKVFQDQCRTCHASQDPMRDAFSSLDFLNGDLIELPPGRAAPKYRRGTTTYPQGHVTVDDHWVNPIAKFKPELGFDPDMTSGQGVEEFGRMLAHSKAFNSCMAQRVFSSVCQRQPGREDDALIAGLASSFESGGHNLKKLFQETASTPACLEENGVKNFRSLYYSLSAVTGVKPTKEIEEYYKSVMTRLPKDGRSDEVNASMLLSEKGLAALFCKELAISGALILPPQALLSELSHRFYGRELSASEMERMLKGFQVWPLPWDRQFIACTAMASSLEFLIQ